jgi:putative hydrolase of the HAD superfamily
MKRNKVVVFDLDDTLYNEIDYLKSAYSQIAFNISDELCIDQIVVFNDMINFYNHNKNVFVEMINKYQLSYKTKHFLEIYRNHKPNITLSTDRLEVIKLIHSQGIAMAILTDGRRVQQRNKLEALGITQYFSEIIISEEFGSEKPDKRNFQYFEKVFGNSQFYYIGDNTKKDFVTPNSLNWITIKVIDNGLNIHKYCDLDFPKKHQAMYNISSFKEITALLS